MTDEVSSGQGAVPSNQTPGTAAGETPAQTQARLHRVKVNDEEFDVSEQDLITNYQMRSASQKAIHEAAQARAQAAQVIKQIKSDPKAAMLELGMSYDDLQKFANNLLNDILTEKSMSPEQRRLKQVESELSKVMKEKQDNDERKRLEMEQRDADFAGKQIANEFVQEFRARGLPETPSLVKRVADYMIAAHTEGVPMSPRQAVAIVEEEYEREFRDMSSKFDDERLLRWLGKERVSGLSKSQLKEVQKRQGGVFPKTTEAIKATPKAGPAKKDFKTPKEAMEAIRNKYRS